MDSLLSLDQASVVKKQKSLPPHITTPRRGPLLLQKQKTLNSSYDQAEQPPRYSKEKRHHSKDQPKSHSYVSGVKVRTQTKRGFLTRYPVVVTPRPMDVIEDHLLKGDMTWSQLKYNVQLMMEDGCGLTAEREGYDSAESAILHHRMKYNSHGNDPLLAIERYTHTMSSANDQNSSGTETINVSITCTSRVPQKLGVRKLSVLPTRQSSLTAALPSSAQIWRGHSPQITQEKQQREHLSVAKEKTVSDSIHRPVSRTSDDVYLTNGVVKTENHRKSTTSPRPLVHPSLLNQPTSEIDIDTVPSSSTIVGEGVKPSKSLQLHLSSHVGPSIAPAGVRAAAMHRLRPITSNTMIKGRGLATVAR